MSGSVLVVGAGVAGVSACLAARRAGVDVTVVEGAPGASTLGPGSWDVCSPTARTDLDAIAPLLPLSDALARYARARPTHPYARLALGADDVRAAHEALLEALDGLYAPWAADGALVASELGVLRRTALAQVPVLDLGPLPDARVAVLDMRSQRQFDGAFIAASLDEQAVAAGDRRRFVAVRMEFLRRGDDAVLAPHEAAQMLDRADARERFVTHLARALGATRVDAVLTPPVLGLTSSRALVAQLRDRLGVPVGELVTSLASPQSMRLAHALRGAIERSGATRVDARVKAVAWDAEGPSATLADGRVLRADALVLATGKHVGGGIEVRDHEPRVALAPLPVFADGLALSLSSSPWGRDPARLFGDDRFAPGLGMRMGVGWSAELCPLDVHGRVACPDLFACGALLDGAREGDGSSPGCAAVTGARAGASAAARARRGAA